MTYNIGDKVVYSSLGVCEILETAANVEALNTNEPYYILAPIIERLGKAYVPHSRANLLRPIISKEEALTIIEKIQHLDADDYQDSNTRLVEDHFKELIKTNDCLQILIVCKSMHARIEAQQNKKPASISTTYKRLLDEAERRAHGELAVALGISEDEVVSFIRNYSCAQK